MRLIRWVLTKDISNLIEKVDSLENKFQIESWNVCKCSLDESVIFNVCALEDTHLLPALETDASNIQQAQKDIFLSAGITISEGDKLINILRAVRDKFGLKDFVEINNQT